MNWCQLLNPSRRRQTSSSNDPRSQFQRDFDRSVFSTPVKRLQDKAQVFPLEPHDAVRTRLTHSLEVSSVARGLASRSAQWLLKQDEISGDMDRSIEAIAATCGLIHDLGNPPFGHAGEDAIRTWFKRQESFPKLLKDQQQTQDFLKFEGNAQSLRLVSKLQILADDSGLNLTFLPKLPKGIPGLLGKGTSTGRVPPVSVGNGLHLRDDRLVRQESPCGAVQWTVGLRLKISSGSC